MKQVITFLVLCLSLLAPLAVSAGSLSGFELGNKNPTNTRADIGTGFTDPTTGMEFVLIKGGCFQMGSNSSEKDDRPVHEVCVDDFYLGKYEVTQDQYQEITGSNPSFFKGGNLPVERVSWDDAQSYLRQLNSRSNQNYRLPTEAEWEYAARNGGKDEIYAGGNNVNAVGWYGGNSKGKTHPVGQKRANELGLYDMTGNVWEWCQDWFGRDYYGKSPRNNPQGPASGTDRANRGGGWFIDARLARVTVRNWFKPDDNRSFALGFRLARPSVP